ncbi:MAG: DUF502 domain-containing protein [Sporomusaceae bacterium]|nr:DUF502 domain-containing protein [Sporomusaceae bacterium]
MKWVSKYFMNGLIVIFPIAFTVWVVMQIFTFSEQLLGQHLPIHFPGVGLMAALLFIILVGWLSSYWLMKSLLGLGERFVNSIPFVKFIYNIVKKLSTAVFNSSQSFKQAVLVPYPHADCRALGFIVSDVSEPLAEHLPDEHVCVFVPMSLNLTSGFNIIVAKKDIIPLDVTNESALEYVLTAGAMMPERVGMKN